MKKLHFIAITIMLTSLMLSGCGGNEFPPQPSDGITDGTASSGQVDKDDPTQTEIDPDAFGTVAEGTETSTDQPLSSGIIPEELEYVPDGYTQPAEQQGSLERLDYQTWESFSYEDKTQQLTKTAWVYLPYGYSEDEQYNVLYLSHGGWSNETTTMGTPNNPHPFKHIVDHAIEDGKIEPLIIVLPTYNNTSASDSGNYSLALQLTNNFHNELVHDLIPAVESKYSTYAQSTDLEGIAASRDHRAFGGFSMGSMNTWRTFEHCLDYFRYFAPSSGGPIGDGEYMADIVRDSGHSQDDFFIFAASGTEDFAYAGFRRGVLAMAEVSDGTFVMADNEQDGNLAYREREGYAHDGRAANEYMYNALRFFWNGDATKSESPVSETSGIAEETGSNILIVYFSMPEDVDVTGVDAISGASIVVDDEQKMGNVEYVAKLVQQTVGGDLFRIETVQPYPLDHDPLVDYAADEQDNNARPALATHIDNLDQYDTIILGYPNWWADLPMPLYTFLEKYDLGGKTIVPFVIHGGSGFSRTRETIADLQPNAQISDNTLLLSRNDVVDSENKVVQWAESLK